MVNALRQQGIEAEIATTNDHGSELLDVPLYQRTEYEGLPVYFFPRYSPSHAAMREFAFSGALTRWLWHQARTYDLVHVHALFSYASTVAMTIARFQNIPYLVRPIGQLCRWSLQQGSLKKQLYLALIERANLQHSQGLHFTSIQEQQEAASLGFQLPSFVLPHGLTLPALLPDARLRLRQWLNLPPDHTIILFLSRLHPKKGLEYLIPALGQLRSQQTFTFVLAGNGTPEYEAELEHLLATTQLQDCTRRVGFVTGDMKELLLQGADLFALTSQSENFGIAVLEALAAGLPVLLTPGIALSTLVQKAQVGWVSELDTTAIAAVLHQFFSDRPTAQQMGQRSRQLIRSYYTWDCTAATLARQYAAILNPSSLLNCEF